MRTHDAIRRDHDNLRKPGKELMWKHGSLVRALTVVVALLGMLASNRVSWSAQTSSNPLIRAIRANDKARVAELIAKGVDVNAVPDARRSDSTPLAEAACVDDGLVTQLVRAGAHVNANTPSPPGGTALLSAASCGKGLSVLELVLEGADLYAKSDRGETALILAAHSRCDSCVDHLLSKAKRGSADEKDDEGRTALMYAARSGHALTVLALLDGGASLEITDAFGRASTVLRALGVEGRGWTALTYAASGGHFETVHALLSQRAVVDHRDTDGNTPLLVAVQRAAVAAQGKRPNEWSPERSKAYLETVTLLLKDGAAVNARNKGGRTALLYSAAHLPEIGQLLKLAGGTY